MTVDLHILVRTLQIFILCVDLSLPIKVFLCYHGLVHIRENHTNALVVHLENKSASRDLGLSYWGQSLQMYHRPI